MPTYGLQANASFPLGTCAFQARAQPPTPARCLPMPLQKQSLRFGSSGGCTNTLILRIPPPAFG